MLCITSCVSGCTTIKITNGEKQEILPRQSFVQIQQSVELEGCGIDAETKQKRCQTAVMRYVSSGAYVFHSEVTQGFSYVLTAGHSCQSKIPKNQDIDGFKVLNKGSTFKAVDLNGFKHDAEVIDINNRFDLCLLRVSDVLMSPPALKVADKEPKRGETVINMAAPHGLFWPGSSGSPIINKDNKLVGVIFAGYPMIENVGLSSPLVAIKVFLKKAIAKGEMSLWEKGNSPKLDTQIDRLWIQKMKTKLDEVFGI